MTLEEGEVGNQETPGSDNWRPVREKRSGSQSFRTGEGPRNTWSGEHG